jgi:hypothetical protein
MWSSFSQALKSDLLDFVSTIQSDTQKTLSKVIGELGENEEVEDEDLLLEKKINDLKRSFLTYSSPIEEEYKHDFNKFMRKFSLSNNAGDIAAILDQEVGVDVSRFYADLVPSELSPEEFWARYFFRLDLLLKGDLYQLDDEEDDEVLDWNDETPEDKDMSEEACILKDSKSVSNTSAHDKFLIKTLKEENLKLKSEVNALVNRITELEKLLSLQSVANEIDSVNNIDHEEASNIQINDYNTTITETDNSIKECYSKNNTATEEYSSSDSEIYESAVALEASKLNSESNPPLKMDESRPKVSSKLSLADDDSEGEGGWDDSWS